MTTTLTAILQATLTWNFQNAYDLSTVPDSTSYKEKQTIADGTADNQANQMYHDRSILTPSTPTDDWDLAGVLTNVFGNTIALTKIRQLFIKNLGVPDGSGSAWTETSGEDLLIGNAASNPITSLFDGDGTSELTLPSGGLLILTAPVDGWAITAGSADTLRVTLDGGGSEDVEYDLIVIGTE